MNRHSEILQHAARRAHRLEPRLARLLEPILDQAGDEAARAFADRATNYLTASLRQADQAALERSTGWLIVGSTSKSEEKARGLVVSLALTAADLGVTSKSTLLCVKPRADEAAALAELSPGTDPAVLHVTLAYLGELEGDLQPVADALAGVAGSHGPLTGIIGGTGEFGMPYMSDEAPPTIPILLPDVPGLVELRVAATEALAAAQVDYSRDHGFEAHLTVRRGVSAGAAYGKPLHFDALCVVRGDTEIIELPLVGRPPLTAAGEPPQWGAPSPDELLDVQALVARLRTKTDPVRQAAVEATMTAALAEAGIDWDVTNPLTARVLAQAGSQVVGIAETTQLNVMRMIREAYEQGLTIPETATAIRVGMHAASRDRALLIARTELVGAVNGGSLAATKIVSGATGVVYEKEWMTAPGAKHPRRDHYDGLNGQRRPLDGYFDVGGYQLDHPGDPDGPPHEICNCRCTMAYVERGR